MEMKKELFGNIEISQPTKHEIEIAMESLYQKISDFYFPEIDIIISDNEMFEEIAERLGIGFRVLNPSESGITELCDICRKFSFITPLVIWEDSTIGSAEKFKEIVDDRWSFYTGTLFRNTKYPATEDVFGEEYTADGISFYNWR